MFAVALNYIGNFSANPQWSIYKMKLFLIGILCSFAVVAGAAVPVQHPYLGFELGYSSSLQANVAVNENPNSLSHFVWDHPIEGWNSRLGNSVIYGAIFGYNLTQLLALELSYNYRPSYQYDKYQTVPTSKAIGSRIRYFDLNNQTFILNGVVHLSALTPDLQTFQARTHIEPIINLGLGVARNTVTNFHGLCVGYQPGMVFSKMEDKTTYDFAAQVGAGVNINLASNWDMRLGYRFLYGGNFKTQDYVTDDPDNQHPLTPGSGNSANAWSGRLLANEVYVNLFYTF